MIKFNIENFTLENLVESCFSTPYGWKREVYVENGHVLFSGPMTKNSYTAKTSNPRQPLDSYVGDVEGMQIGDFEGFTVTETKDGKPLIKVNDKRVSRRTAIEIISSIYDDDEFNPLKILYNEIIKKIGDQ